MIMELSVYAFSNKGARAHNEDSWDAHLSEKGGVFVLADGLGGHRKGEAASRMAVEIIMEALRALDAPDETAVREAFLAANAAIMEKQAEPDCKGMKTTAVALHIIGNEAIWAHAGDSRLYHFSGGVQAITKDHSVTYKKYLGGEIAYRDIRNDEDRSSLLCVLGGGKCVPEVSAARSLKPGDAFLLCSDGFWEYVQDEEMLIDLLKSDTPKEWIEYMLLRHIRRADARNDNYTAIAVFVGD